MNRRILLFWLWSSAASLCADQPPAEPRRFLFVVDTSFSMAPRKETLRNTAYDLIYGGIGGEMRPGDLFSFWTFNENPDTRKFPPVEWDPGQTQALANQAYVFFKNQPFQKISRFDKALVEILRSSQEVASLTIVILSDGLEFVRGTPFDGEINKAYAERSPELRRSDKPFITVLQSTRGQIVGWSIAAVGEPVHVPDLPITARSAQAEQPAALLAVETAFSEKEVVPLPARPSQPDPMPPLVERGSIPPVHAETVVKPVVMPHAGPPEDSLASLTGKIEMAPATAERNTDQERRSRPSETVPPLPGPSAPVTFSSIENAAIPPATALQPASDSKDSTRKTHSIKTDDLGREETLLARNLSAEASKAATGNSDNSVTTLSKAAVNLKRNDQVNFKDSPGIRAGAERTPKDPLVRGGALVPPAAVVFPGEPRRFRWEYFVPGVLSLLGALGLIFFLRRKPLSASRSSLISTSISRNSK